VYSEVHDPYDSGRSRVVQLVNSISLEGYGGYTDVYGPYDSCDSYGS